MKREASSQSRVLRLSPLRRAPSQRLVRIALGVSSAAVRILLNTYMDFGVLMKSYRKARAMHKGDEGGGLFFGCAEAAVKGDAIRERGKSTDDRVESHFDARRLSSTPELLILLPQLLQLLVLLLDPRL